MRRAFDALYAKAVERHGPEVIEERLPSVKSAAELAAVGDDRYLSCMAQTVFSAGFVWRVIQAKWPGFEEAFKGFDPLQVAALDPEVLVADARIVRNGQKIAATQENARWMLEVAEEHGGFSDFIAAWPEDDVVGLWQTLAKQGSRLGGATGPRFLRHMGKDTFILTGDVTRSLTDQGILTGKPTSKKQQLLAQEAFLEWRQESGRSFGEISMIVAATVPREA